jgi:hypothetical protein
MGNGWQKPGGKGLSGDSGTLFAEGSRNSDTMGDFFSWRIPSHCLVIVPEPRKEGGFLFCRRIRDNFLSRVPETQIGMGIFYCGKSRSLFAAGDRNPDRKGDFFFGGNHGS